jgi:hypothetical protein
MVILNFKGVHTYATMAAFARLVGEKPSYAFNFTTADCIRMREKVRKAK